MTATWPGILIVIEGIDGSGKDTQTRRLVERVEAIYPDKNVKRISFPRYGQPSARPIEAYLGRSGSIPDLPPIEAAALYARDRYVASYEDGPDGEKSLITLLREGVIIFSDRYTQSNFGHQGGRILNRADREAFIRDVNYYEYEVLKIPRPTMVILIDITAEEAMRRKVAQRLASGEVLDAHEGDPEMYRRAREAYHYAMVLDERIWRIVDGNQPVSDVSHQILKIVMELI